MSFEREITISVAGDLIAEEKKEIKKDAKAGHDTFLKYFEHKP